ncbi:hypothetical protein ACIBQX_35295 [Nonomuraea sp. NPDC049714]|uniref:hypothetical protein n=1 Tax=Nonomuraea sp. NPDC049714 TaxID=3364357 RepID=UPI0037B17BFF
MARGDGGGRDSLGEPKWWPVSDLDMMTAIALEQLDANRDQLRTLKRLGALRICWMTTALSGSSRCSGSSATTCDCGTTSQRWQAQNLNVAEAAQVDQYVAAVAAPKTD